MTAAATDRQVAYIVKLAGERDTPVAGSTVKEAGIIARFEDVLGRSKFVSKGEASTVISWLLAQRPTAAAVAAAVERKTNAEEAQKAQPGVYVLDDGSIVKVQQNKAKTNVYAMRWVDSGERIIDATGEWARGDWDYERGLIFAIGDARQMGLDEAKAFILRYGRCVRCNLKLKAAMSVERGIGPVCVKYFSQFTTAGSVAQAATLTLSDENREESR